MTTSTLPAIVAALYALTLVLFIGLHLRSGRNPVREAVSAYAFGPTRWLFLLDGAAGGLAAALLGAILLEDARFPALGAFCLLAHAGFRVGVLGFRADPDGHAGSRHARLHYGFAFPGFLTAMLAIHVLMPEAMAITPAAAKVALDLLYAVAGTSLAGVIACLFPPMVAAFGLLERCFLLSTSLWLASLALTLALSA